MELAYDDGGNVIYYADDGQWYYYDDYVQDYGDTEGVYSSDVADDTSAADGAAVPAYAPQAQSFLQTLEGSVYQSLFDPNDPQSVVGFAKEYGPTVFGLAASIV